MTTTLLPPVAPARPATPPRPRHPDQPQPPFKCGHTREAFIYRDPDEPPTGDWLTSGSQWVCPMCFTCLGWPEALYNGQPLFTPDEEARLGTLTPEEIRGVPRAPR